MCQQRHLMGFNNVIFLSSTKASLLYSEISLYSNSIAWCMYCIAEQIEDAKCVSKSLSVLLNQRNLKHDNGSCILDLAHLSNAT